jgi:hypothetical protein
MANSYDPPVCDLSDTWPLTMNNRERVDRFFNEAILGIRVNLFD